MNSPNSTRPINIPIANMLKSARIPHAIILEGDETEREFLASYITRYALCTGEDKPCGMCSACKKTESGHHPDVTELFGEGATKAIKIEQVRKLRQDAYIIPNEGAYKIYLLHDGDNMTPEAQNALLKVLEEPPAYVIFLLLCKNRTHLLLTVQSRSVTVKTGGTILDNGAAKAAAEELVLALYSDEELELLKLLLPYPSDKEGFRLVLSELSEILRQAYHHKLKNSTEGDIAYSLSQRLTLVQLFALLDAVDVTLAAIDRNANMGLLTTRFGAALRRSLEA